MKRLILGTGGGLCTVSEADTPKQATDKPDHDAEARDEGRGASAPRLCERDEKQGWEAQKSEDGVLKRDVRIIGALLIGRIRGLAKPAWSAIVHGYAAVRARLREAGHLSSAFAAGLKHVVLPISPPLAEGGV